MFYNISDIIKEVRIALDENEASVPLIADDSNTLSLDEIIGQKLLHAIRTVSESAPYTMLQDAPSLPVANLRMNDDGSGQLPLPDDFLRLVIFRMNDWSRAVTDPIDETDAEYTMQRSKYTGVRGNAQRPVCALVSKNTGQVLEFFSCDDKTASVDIAKYIKIPTIVELSTGERAVEICQRVYTPVIYYTAGLSAAALKAENADALFKIATDYLSS